MDSNIVTVIGMIAAFLTAYLAPILSEKIQHKAKIERLRTALYKELIVNYVHLEDKNFVDSKYTKKILVRYSKHSILTECYQSAINNSLFDFYELPESLFINELYLTLRVVKNLPEEKLLSNAKGNAEYKRTYNEYTQGFVKLMPYYVYNDALDAETFRKLIKKDAFDELMSMGEKFSKESD